MFSSLVRDVKGSGNTGFLIYAKTSSSNKSSPSLPGIFSHSQLSEQGSKMPENTLKEKGQLKGKRSSTVCFIFLLVGHQ